MRGIEHHTHAHALTDTRPRTPTGIDTHTHTHTHTSMHAQTNPRRTFGALEARMGKICDRGCTGKAALGRGQHARAGGGRQRDRIGRGTRGQVRGANGLAGGARVEGLCCAAARWRGHGKQRRRQLPEGIPRGVRGRGAHVAGSMVGTGPAVLGSVRALPHWIKGGIARDARRRAAVGPGAGRAGIGGLHALGRPAGRSGYSSQQRKNLSSREHTQTPTQTHTHTHTGASLKSAS
jgi:hypothetical protein